ncbi:hypothetical protein BD309DRAFT_862921 [Dichomitus squalens]|nr:hypothetical protein BD309DRAFT_862921 [Dichomitus squalens]
MYNLPADVIHQILEDSPDLATLGAAIRVSRKHHEVFQTHPKSIIRAVIANVVGAALLPALRLAEYLHQCSQENVDIEGLPDESHLAALDLTNSGHLLSILKRNAHTVHVLRDFYSLRHATP